jgi:transposase
MLDVAKSLPEDPEELRRFTALLLAEVKSQAMLIEKLRHQLAGHRSHRFGSSSETIEQLQLALEASEISVAKMTAKLRLPDEEEKDKPKRRPIPDHIPRQEIELTTGDDDCAHCGSTLRRLGEDVTEELEYVPGRFVVNRIVRPRMACSGCEAFTQAPLPSRPIERGRPGPGLLAHVMVSKYADHLPLYRQSQIFEREGLDLDRSTLADWVGKSTALLEPLADAIGRHVLAGHRAALCRREGGAGIATGPACRDPPGESGTDLRRVGKLAARATADDLRQVAAGHGNPVWPDAHEAASALSRSRLSRTGQQHG